LERGFCEPPLCGPNYGAGEADQRIGGLREGKDVVPDFFGGGVKFDREDFFAFHGVAGERAVGETGAEDCAVLFRLLA